MADASINAPPAGPLTGAEQVLVIQGSTVVLTTLADAAAFIADPLSSRVAALEAKPEEVAHFGALAALPNVAALAKFTVTLTGLVPAKPGDALKAGESVSVQPLTALPDGVTMTSPPTVPADGTVLLKFTAGVALTSAPTIQWAISALR